MTEASEEMMTGMSKERLLDRIALAFRLAGDDKRFREHAADKDVTISFRVHRPAVAGTVRIKDGRISWGTGHPAALDVSVDWQDWPALRAWVQGRMPLWWSRLRRHVTVRGGWNPVFLECIYLFRYNLKTVLETQRGQGK